LCDFSASVPCGSAAAGGDAVGQSGRAWKTGDRLVQVGAEQEQVPGHACPFGCSSMQRVPFAGLPEFLKRDLLFILD
jgi:hypothetical protein